MITKLSYLLIVLLISLISVPFCACSKDVSNLSATKTSEPDEAFLEIKENATGWAFPRGERLMMKLYKSGHFEYDAYPDANTPADSEGNVLFERKQGKASQEDLNELLNLAQQPDFLAARDFYPSTRPHTDDKRTTTIIYKNNERRKEIVIDDFWDVDSFPEDKSKYPTSLVELMNRQRKLVAKAVVNELKQNLMNGK